MKYFGPKSFTKLYDDITQASFKKYGFINGKLISEWQSIVGEQLSSICKPLQIVFEPGQTREGVLHVALSNSSFGLILQSHENRIIEKISTFFGYKAVSKMRIILKPKKMSEILDDVQDHKNKTSFNVFNEIPDALNTVADEELKEILTSLYISLNDNK